MWVKCFILYRFTIDIQLTQQVESENAFIQKAVQFLFSLVKIRQIRYMTNQLTFGYHLAKFDKNLKFEKKSDIYQSSKIWPKFRKNHKIWTLS